MKRRTKRKVLRDITIILFVIGFFFVITEAGAGGLFGFTFTPAGSLQEGLVAHYTFDSNDVINGAVRDATGNGNDGGFVPSNSPSTTTVTYTSSDTFFVPGGVDLLQIKAWGGGGSGAGGGTSGAGGAGGGGGFAQVEIEVDQGEPLTVSVSAASVEGDFSTGGGGNSSGDGGGGGGYSAVLYKKEHVVIAGGGGGGGGGDNSSSTPGGDGGEGGASTGASGSGSGSTTGGNGGSQTAGGSAGSGATTGEAGSSLDGGHGPSGGACGNADLGEMENGAQPGGAHGGIADDETAGCAGGGGGGGGYFGGGGGGNSTAANAGGGGGGGGSNFVSGFNTVSTQASGSTAANTGDSDYPASTGDGGSGGSTSSSGTAGERGAVVLKYSADTYRDAATSTAQGAIGQALEFSGFDDDDYVDFGDDAEFEFATSDFAISAWVKPSLNSKAASANQTIFSKWGAAGNQREYRFALDNVTGGFEPVFEIRDASQVSRSASSSTALPYDTWHHLVAIRDGTTLTLYANGEQVSQITNGHATIHTGTALAKTGVLHTSGGDNTQPFNGAIDDLRIYNRVISATEVSRLYDLGSSAHQSVSFTPPALAAAGGLVSHYTFDGKNVSNSTVSDVVGSRDGTFSGGSSGGGGTTTVTYSSTGADTFVVPAGVTNILVKAWGAGGGGGGGGDDTDAGGTGGAGGGGGFAQGDVSVTPGETLTLHIGGAGGLGNGNGGSLEGGDGGGGGGRTSVYRSSTALIVAGAGGGGGGGDNNASTGGGAGGAGGGSTGAAGGDSGDQTGGGGGTQSAGGAAGSGGDNTGQAGASLAGGDGADGRSSQGADGGANNGGATSGGDGGDHVSSGRPAGGGGGSGYFGGGGGGGAGSSGSQSGSGGGGGSNYVGGGTNTVNTQASGSTAANTGDADYPGSVGDGGAGGAASGGNGSAGENGYLVIKYSGVGPLSDAAITSGPVGQSLRFNGTDDTILVSADSALSLTRFTVALWIKPNNTLSSSVIEQPFKKTINNSTGRSNYEFSWSHTSAGSQKSFGFWDGSAFEFAQISSDMRAGTWYHVVGTYDGTNLRAYLNGSLEDTEAATDPATGLEDMAIGSGRSSDALSSPFNGSIDDFRIYDRPLSESEIAQLYNLGKSAHVSTSYTPPDLEDGLVGHWPFDGKHTNWETQTTNDVTGLAGNGTIENMSTSSSPIAGKIGQGFDFDGTDDRISVTTGSAINGLTDMTISAWIKPRSGGDGSFGRILQKGLTASPSAGECRISIHFGSANAQGITFTFRACYSTDEGTWDNVTQRVPLNKWTHVVYTYTHGDTTADPLMYINGELTPLRRSNEPKGSATADDTTLAIGDWGVGTRVWDGGLDDIRFYNRVLTAQEVRRLYNLGR